MKNTTKKKETKRKNKRLAFQTAFKQPWKLFEIVSNAPTTIG